MESGPPPDATRTRPLRLYPFPSDEREAIAVAVKPTDLPRRFDRSIPVWPVLESRPLVVWTDRAGDTWVPTTRTTYDGERLLECQSPQEPADQGEGDSFRWTYRSVAAWFGPLQERRMGGAA